MNPKLSLALGIIFISFSPIFVKLADASPIVCAFHRIFFAWIFLLPYCLYKRNLKMERKDIILAMVILAGYSYSYCRYDNIGGHCQRAATKI